MSLTHLEQLSIGQHALIEARVQKVGMIPQQPVHRVSMREPGHQVAPVRLQHLTDSEPKHLFHKAKHLGTERDDSTLPHLELGKDCFPPPDRQFSLFDPDEREHLL